MEKKLLFLSFIVLLSGCGETNSSLELTKEDIYTFCDDVAQGVAAELESRDSNKPTPLRVLAMRSGAEAECILEYRIKQQEARKPF
jgi:hypothetical protein